MLIAIQVWFIDANVFAHWVISKGKVMDIMKAKYRLSDEFVGVYQKKYQDSTRFIETVRKRKRGGLKDEFFISSLALNEVFAAVRDEVRSIILFKEGVPISRWRDPRNNPSIEKPTAEDVYQAVMHSFDMPFLEESISPFTEMSCTTAGGQKYWDVCASLLFLIKEMKTQDATLLTTAIFNRADYFVTKDRALKKCARKFTKPAYGLNLVTPTYAIDLLRKRPI